MKNKKALWISIIAVDVAITVALFVIHIIMLTILLKNSGNEQAIREMGGLFGYLANHTWFYFWLFVVPLFLLLAANIVGLVIYVRNQGKKQPLKVNDLTDEQKEELKKQILKELSNETKEDAPKAEE